MTQPVGAVLAVLLGSAAIAIGDAAAPGALAAPFTPGVVEECEAAARPARLDFRLKDVRGASVTLADFKGKVIVLNFWATWCAPCKTEIPDFVELHARHAEAGLQLLGIAVDDTVKQLRPFVDAWKMNYPVLQGRGQNALLDAYSISTLPVTVLVGRDGAICRRYTGPVAKESLERHIKLLL